MPQLQQVDLQVGARDSDSEFPAGATLAALALAVTRQCHGQCQWPGRPWANGRCHCTRRLPMALAVATCRQLALRIRRLRVGVTATGTGRLPVCELLRLNFASACSERA